MAKPKNNFEVIAAQAAEIADRHTKLDVGSVAINCFLLMFLAPLISTDDKSAHKTTPIGDDWLAAVAGLPQISKDGLALLAHALEKKGWVSIEEAGRFVQIEIAAGEKERERAEAVESMEQPGASMLLARAEHELPGTIERFANGAKDFGQAAVDVVAFAANKAALLGKSTVATLTKARRSPPEN